MIKKMKQSTWGQRHLQPIDINAVMRLILIGLFLSVLTTFILQFAMYFQAWGRYNQVTQLGTALHYSWQFMFKSQAWFGVFECFAVFSLLMALINRVFITIALYVVIAIVVFVAEYMKVKARNEPIIFSDLAEASAASGLSSMVEPKLLTGAVLLIAVLVISAIILEVGLKKRRMGMFAQRVSHILYQQAWTRIGVILLAGYVLILPFVSSADGNQRWLNRFGYQRVVYSSGDDSLWNGPMMTFISNISTVIMREPAGYSAAKMAAIDKKYAAYAKQMNVNRPQNLKGQTVIYLLSESLTNPNDVPSLTYNGPNVSTNMDRLKAEAVVSGKMLSSGYGGGTANIEYMTLTGMPLATYAPEMTVPYVQVVPFAKQVPNITNGFNQKDVLHPFVGSLYNRRAAYQKMGINNFYTTDSKTAVYPKRYQAGVKDGDYTSDDNAFKFLLSKIDQPKQNTAQFLQLMTMQNHMPYLDGEYPNNPYTIKTPAVSASTQKQMASYLEGVHLTDEALGNMTAKLDKMKRPVTMVVYGDHWPGVFTFVDSQAAAKVAHETDYFVYQNAAAKRKAGQENVQQRQFASPSDFPALTLAATNSKVSPYFALQTQLTTQLPAIANYARNAFVDQSGQELDTSDLTTKQKALLRDLKYVQYDLSAGQHYLSKKFTKTAQ